MPAAPGDQQAPRPQEVFISYSRKDKEFVRRLDEELKRRDREAWVDWEDIRPTEDFMQAIYGAIEGSDTFISVLTPDSVASVVCGREIAHAAAHNKRMVPIVARDVNPDTVPEPLAKLNWIFCREIDDFKKATDTLISAFDTDLEWVHAHTRLLTRAIEWEAKGKSNSFVLRGEDLRSAERWLAEAGAQKERQPTALQTEYILTSRHASSRRLRMFLGIAVAVVAITIVLAARAYLEQLSATSREFAVTALSQLKSDPMRSLGIATEAVNKWQTAEAVGALRQALQETSYERAELQHHDKAPVASATFSADGTRVLTAGQHGEIHVWDPTTPQQPLASFTHQGTLSAAVLSRDARYMLTAAGDKAGDGGYAQQQSSTVHVWDITRRTGGPVASLKQVGNVYAAAMSPDSRIAVTAGIDCTARLWAWGEKDREPTVLQGDLCHPHDTVNETLAAVRHAENECHPSRDPQWGGWGSRQGVFAAAVSPDGQLVATGGGDCLVRVWDTATGQLRSVLAGHTAEVTRLVFSPDGAYLVSASGLPGGGFDSVPWVWDVGAWEGHALLGWRSNDRVFAVAVSPNSQFVAVTYGDDVVRVWNAKTREPWAKLLGHTHWVGNAAFSPVDSRLLVTTGGEDGTVRIWDIGANPDQGRELFVLRGHTDAVGSAVFSRKRGQLVTTSHDGTARLWDLNLGEPLERLPDNLAIMRNDASISPDKKFTLTLDDRNVKVHDSVNNKDLPPLQGHLQRISSAEFSHDGKLIVTAGGADNTARIWDASSHAPLTTLRGHSASVLSAKFDQTGTFVVTAGADETARVWDVATGQNLVTLVNRDEPFAGAAFSRDNTFVITWSDDGRFVKRYRCEVCGSVDDLLKLAKQRVARRPLTVDERKRFLHEDSHSWMLHW
jgi:WD40 repeat protein